MTAVAAFAAGALAVGALPPWSLWPLFFVGLGGLYVLLARLPAGATGRAWVVGWLFGFGWFAVGLAWIGNALLVPGVPFRWVWPFVIGALPALLAVFPASACALAVRGFSLRRVSGLLAFVTVMTVAEWLRGHVLSGFPWNLYAYVWSESPIVMQAAALGGSWLLDVVTLFWATVPAFLLVRAPARRPWLVPVRAVATVAGFGAYGAARLRHPIERHAGVRLHLVQPNVAQSDKVDPRRAEESLAVLLELSRRGPEADGATVVVWPETAITSRMLATPRLRRAIGEALMSHRAPTVLVSGVLRRDDAGRLFNSVLALDRDAAPIASYDKAHLVPFAEHVPLPSILALAPFVNRIASFTAGPGPVTMIADPALPAFAPAVCYEVVFPHAVVATAEQRPQWILNVTNDAWFGDSAGPYQHFAQARFRAVEEGLPVVRVANAGISGVIDPFGQSVVTSALFMRTVLVTGLPLPLAPTLYARLGDVPVLALLALAAAIAVLVRRAESRTDDVA